MFYFYLNKRKSKKAIYIKFLSNNMSNSELILKTSEDATLTNRGYKLLKKLSEGTYAKVIF